MGCVLHTRENTPVDILRDCKLVLQENKRINTQLHAQLASYQRMRDEVEISYTAARLGVVHSIPAAFTITEPDPLEREKRAKLVQQYNEMNAEISEIQEKLTNLQEEKRELFDYLHNKYKNSKDYYKEIVDEYNFIIGNVVKLNKLLKTDQWMRRHMTDADVMKKFNEMAKVNQSLKLLQESNNTINASETTVDAGSVNSKNVLEEGTHSTVPDKPNTLAFWLVEGKFRT
eukprot:XP_763113.1 hypothetical protein [Theileria parva strain Muguga]